MTSGQLTKQLKKVLNQWPLDSSRKGRDLGEYLKHHYLKVFEQQLKTDVGLSDSSCCLVECLEYSLQREGGESLVIIHQMITGVYAICNLCLHKNTSLNALTISKTPS